MLSTFAEVTQEALTLQSQPGGEITMLPENVTLQL